jgi:exopolyphosphatase/guanosine-5'-triphosphate,3'-diphosphate pyrophosphatase
MSIVRRAVIDVGTNSVKLLVADVSGRKVHPILEDSKQTRLGQGFYETCRLQGGPIAATAYAVARFAATARACKAASIRVIATSAARDAINPDDLLSAIAEASGLPMEIISGDKEAEWAFRGVTTDARFATEPLLLLDAGGGSTEFILGKGGQTHFRASFPLGTVRLLEKFSHGDPPGPEALAGCREWLRQFLSTEVRPGLEPAMHSEAKLSPEGPRLRLIGTGGTTSILGRMEAKLDVYDRARIESIQLSLDRIRWHVEHLWGLPLFERQQVVGLPRKRADVILLGVTIYEAVMEQFGFDHLAISTRGLRFAAVMDS